MRDHRLKVFVASPGDVQDERQAAREIIAQLQESEAFRGRVVLEPIAWDAVAGGVPSTALESPQDAIIEALTRPSQCDIVIVIFWSRMGTPLPDRYCKPDGQPYASGTEWEYEDAIRGTDGGKKRPHVLLYRSARPITFAPLERNFNEAFAQFTEVKKFFDRCIDDRGAIVHSVHRFSDTVDFRAQLENHLKQKIHQIINPRRDPVIHNLPPRSNGQLLGRQDEIAAVAETLHGDSPVVVIDGAPGIGKSRLALEIGYLYAREIEPPPDVIREGFECVLWLNSRSVKLADEEVSHDRTEIALDGRQKPQWVHDILNLITQAVNEESQGRGAGARTDTQRMNDVLLQHRVLMIIDNLQPEARALYKCLAKIPTPSKVLVTSRFDVADAPVVRLAGLPKEAAVEFIRQQARSLNLQQFESMEQQHLDDLLAATGRNPMAIKLVLGQVAQYKPLQAVLSGLENQGDIFKTLYRDTWKLLSPDAKAVLRSIAIFAGGKSIGRDALAATTGLSGEAFDSAIFQVLRFKLLEFNSITARYSVPPITRGFAADELRKLPTVETQARRRLRDFYLTFVTQYARRDQPSERYWNALVTKSMESIDPEWSNIRDVIKWAHNRAEEEAVDRAEHRSAVLELVMLLVHYMDSRFYHADRINFVNMAIKAANELGKKEDEAILRIDALGWTYVDEGQMDLAKQSIDAGMKIALKLSPDISNRLIALGYIWKARLELEQNSLQAAQENGALSAGCPHDSKVIAYRQLLLGGDLDFRKNRPAHALKQYRQAVRCSDTYGGEGGGYQTLPRIGLALAARDEFDEAEKCFRSLEKLSSRTAQLYATYGLALIAYKRGDSDVARNLSEAAAAELTLLTKNNVLFRLTEKLLADAKRGHDRKVKREKRDHGRSSERRGDAPRADSPSRPKTPRPRNP